MAAFPLKEREKTRPNSLADKATSSIGIRDKRGDKTRLQNTAFSNILTRSILANSCPFT